MSGDALILLPLFAILLLELAATFAAEAGRWRRERRSLLKLVEAQSSAVSALEQEVSAKDKLDAARLEHIAALEKQATAYMEHGINHG